MRAAQDDDVVGGGLDADFAFELRGDFQQLLRFVGVRSRSQSALEHPDDQICSVPDLAEEGALVAFDRLMKLPGLSALCGGAYDREARHQQRDGCRDPAAPPLTPSDLAKAETTLAPHNHPAQHE